MSSSPLLLAAKPVAAHLREDTAARVQQLKARHGRVPKLSVVLVGEDPASVIYTSKKGEAALAAGMEHETIRLPAASSPESVQTTIDRLNRDPHVDGILLQRPLPKGFVEEKVVYWVAPEKDVDAFHPENAGRMFLGLPSFQPCTPAGVMAILAHYRQGVAGKVACVVGRSSIVGKPMAAMLLAADASVIHCHSKTPDLARLTRQAQILVVAAGKRELVGADHVADGAVVVDVGMHRKEDGKLCGDVRFDEVSKKCSAITPVPGGVGPMTIAVLLQNTVRAAELRGAAR
jgi:methylenetetrahydrofolate dehydrogenase (NADP+)/methenyltetrahydrofolate cyclohydrolase